MLQSLTSTWIRVYPGCGEGEANPGMGLSPNRIRIQPRTRLRRYKIAGYRRSSYGMNIPDNVARSTK